VTVNIVVARDVLPPDLPAEPEARMTILLDRQVAQMRTRREDAGLELRAEELEGERNSPSRPPSSSFPNFWS
jgi:hypothetical protein